MNKKGDLVIKIYINNMHHKYVRRLLLPSLLKNSIRLEQWPHLKEEPTWYHFRGLGFGWVGENTHS